MIERGGYLLFVAVVTFATSAAASQPGLPSLAGVRRIGVGVNSSPEAVAITGKSEHELRTRASTLLRAAGFVILSEEQRQRELGRPIVWIDIDTLVFKRPTLRGIWIEISFFQDVLIVRQQSKRAHSRTWVSAPGYSDLGPTGRRADISTLVDLVVKDFIKFQKEADRLASK